MRTNTALRKTRAERIVDVLIRQELPADEKETTRWVAAGQNDSTKLHGLNHIVSFDRKSQRSCSRQWTATVRARCNVLFAWN